MQFLKSLLTTLINIFLFAILPIVVVTLVTSKTGLLAGLRSFVVLTGSMTPSIPVGSIVYSVPSQQYEKGDIISFDRDDVTITHRVIGVEEQDGQRVYRTQGDANNAADTEPVLAKDVIGKEIVQFPVIGRLVLWLKTIPGFLVGIIIPGLIVVSIEVWKIKKEMEKDIERKLLNRMQSNAQR